jgi:hypothetical protein
MSNGSNSGAAGGIGLVTIILALVFLFVWPGPLRYEYRDVPATLSITKGGIEPIPAGCKIDRISGDIWDYKNGTWVKR